MIISLIQESGRLLGKSIQKMTEPDVIKDTMREIEEQIFNGKIKQFVLKANQDVATKTYMTRKTYEDQ